jgi:DHA2 family metal-tetracycline-proton antiporter-like MFS transporter
MLERSGESEMSLATNEALVKEPLNQSEKRKVIFLLCSVLMFSVMNGTMFMIAIPEIAQYFSLLPSQVSWVVTGYIIFYAIGALMYGKLADIYPLKRLLTIGLILFATGSLFGFFASNYFMVVLARMIQAAGAATVPALVFIAPSRYFPTEKGKVLGIISSTMAIASGIGPVIGGFIAGAFGWQYLFIISFFVILTVPFFWYWLPEEEKQEGKVDIPGALLMGVGMASFILFITTFNVSFLITSLILLSLFTWRIMKTKYPFIRPDLFRNVPFRTTIFTSFLGIFTMFSMMFLLPLLLSEVNGLTTQSIGFVLFPGAVCAALIGGFVGRLTDRIGSRPVVYLALALMVSGFFLLSTFIGNAAWMISIVLIITYIAFPFLQTSTATLISATLPGSQIGIGMGIYNLCNFMSGAFGGAIIGKILDHNFAGWAFNPLTQAKGSAIIYSNLFVGLIILTLLNGTIFYFVFRGLKKD